MFGTFKPHQEIAATPPQEKPKRKQSIFNENSHSIEEIKMITMFDVKMILIGSAAMMFSKVCGMNLSLSNNFLTC